MEENTQPQFTPGQILYIMGLEKEYVQCEYMRHMRADVHLVKVNEGTYRGTYWKSTDELLTEKPE